MISFIHVIPNYIFHHVGLLSLICTFLLSPLLSSPISSGSPYFSLAYSSKQLTSLQSLVESQPKRIFLRNNLLPSSFQSPVVRTPMLKTVVGKILDNIQALSPRYVPVSMLLYEKIKKKGSRQQQYSVNQPRKNPVCKYLIYLK